MPRCAAAVSNLSSCLDWRADTFHLLCLMCLPSGVLMSHLQGEFSLGGNFPAVRDNVQLIQGLFNDTLPPFIQHHYRDREHHDITYLHIDCDLYHGEHSGFRLLAWFLQWQSLYGTTIFSCETLCSYQAPCCKQYISFHLCTEDIFLERMLGCSSCMSCCIG